MVKEAQSKIKAVVAVFIVPRIGKREKLINRSTAITKIIVSYGWSLVESNECSYWSIHGQMAMAQPKCWTDGQQLHVGYFDFFILAYHYFTQLQPYNNYKTLITGKQSVLFSLWFQCLPDFGLREHWDSQEHKWTVSTRTSN